MEKFAEIENILWDMTVDDIKFNCKYINCRTKSVKADTINNIMKIYNDNFINDSYYALNDLEKELIDNFVQQKGSPLDETIVDIKNKYPNLEMTFLYNRFFIWKHYYGARMPNVIYEALLDIVPKREYTFTSNNPGDLDDYYGYIVDRENRVTDFDYYVKYINASKIKPTAKNKLLTKKDFIKIQNELKYMEVDRADDIKTIEDTIVSYGIFKLLIAGNVIKSTSEYFELGIYSHDFARFNKLEKVKFLFDKYINCSSIYINEISRITRAGIKTDLIPELRFSREYLVSILKKLPIDEWVSGDEFKKIVRMDNCGFLREHLKTYLVRDDYSKAYDTYPSFFELEEAFIDIFLTEYMAVLGIIDVTVIHETCGYWDQREANLVTNLRLTKFGAMTLGLIPEEIINNEDLGFEIDSNYHIKIFDGESKMKYELYFERFLDKNKDGTYNLDFIGICKALDLGIDLEDIIDYIKTYGNKINNNIICTLNKWLEDSKKVKIKTVNIVEFPDELSHLFSSNSNIEKTKNNYLIVKSGKNHKLKEEIQKKNIYCEDKT